jgi:hypothetical protein
VPRANGRRATTERTPSQRIESNSDRRILAFGCQKRNQKARLLIHKRRESGAMRRAGSSCPHVKSALDEMGRTTGWTPSRRSRWMETSINWTPQSIFDGCRRAPIRHLTAFSTDADEHRLDASQRSRWMDTSIGWTPHSALDGWIRASVGRLTAPSMDGGEHRLDASQRSRWMEASIGWTPHSALDGWRRASVGRLTALSTDGGEHPLDASQRSRWMEASIDWTPHRMQTSIGWTPHSILDGWRRASIGRVKTSSTDALHPSFDELTVRDGWRQRSTGLVKALPQSPLD